MTTQEMKLFNQARLNELRKVRKENEKSYWLEDPYYYFWEELEAILRTKQEKGSWKKLEGDDVLGDVWEQQIGEYHHRHTVHRFSYLYVESRGIAIAEHGHEEPANRGKQRRKIKEWYVFLDGRIEICKKDEKHRLVNNSGRPIYVLSIKICSNGTR